MTFPPRLPRRRLPFLPVALLAGALWATSAGGQTRAPEPPPAQGARPAAARSGLPLPPQGAFEVVEWVVFVADPSQPAANGERLFRSTLPDFVGGRRPAAPAASAGQPSPVCAIRLRGADEGTKVDVLLQAPSGRFMGQWPKGKPRSDRQLWEAYELKSAAPPGLAEIPAGHWLAALREGDGLFLQRGRAAERFLLYDVEINYPLPLHISQGKDGAYQVANSGAAALHELTLYQPQGEKWRSGALAAIAAAKDAQPSTNAATRPATSPAAGGVRAGIPPEIAARMQARRAAGVVAAPAAPPPMPVATQPSPGATKVAVAVDAAAAGAAEALSPWKARLAAEGLPDADVALILRILERHALDPRRLTAVYRLDPAELDRMLPLEVTPAPRKTVRVGLVVARNVDPSVADEIDQLIAKLADPSWDEREAAQKQLAELGPAARPKLQAVLQSKDLEVVWRAERLLQALDTQPTSLRRR